MNTGSLLRNEIRRGAFNALLTNSLLLPACLGGIALFLSVGGRKGSDIAVMVGLGVVAFVNVVSILIALRHRGNPEGHPSVRDFCKSYGVSLDQLSARFEQELAGAARCPIFAGVRLLPSWIYRRGTFGITLIPIDEIAWVHKKVTTKRVNFVPITKTYQLVLYTLYPLHNQMPFEFTAESQVVDQFLATVAHQVPWAFIGWDQARQANWRHNRAGVTKNLAARREAVRSGGVAASAVGGLPGVT